MSKVYIGLILLYFIELSLQANCTNQRKPIEYFVEKYGRDGTLNLIESLVEVDAINPFDKECVLSSSNLETLKSLNEYTLNEICPHILEFIDSSINSNLEKVDDIIEEKSSYVWQLGFLSVTIISLCSLIGIGILPLMKKSYYNKVLMYLICLAVGTLSCNAFFQLLPEGFDIDSDPMTVWRSAVVFLGCYVFYLIDSVLEIIFGIPHNEEYELNSEVSVETKSTKQGSTLCLKNDLGSHTNWKPNETEELIIISPSEESVEQSVQRKSCWLCINYKSIKAIAWMITVADGMHNFIDGLAIGASFSTSTAQGVSTSVAIFCEEFPHELGDFAILLSAGMSVKQAAFYNFASACCCYIGLIIGVLVGHDMQAARWIFSLAGGVFLYISLAGMLPEAHNLSKKNDLKNKKWLCFFVQNLGLLSGFLAMFVLTLYSDKIQF